MAWASSSPREVEEVYRGAAARRSKVVVDRGAAVSVGEGPPGAHERAIYIDVRGSGLRRRHEHSY